MNVSTITVDQNTAVAKIADLKSLKRSQRTNADDQFLSLYSAVVKRGARVINILDAFRATGLNEYGQPKLAIARGDWQTVFFHPRRSITVWDDGSYSINRWADGAGVFEKTGQFKPHAYASPISLPLNTLNAADLARQSVKSAVPYVPANLRPKFHLRNYHILFEVEKWETYPVDPFLLRHVCGYLYTVEAEWELTELEASLLGSMRGN